MFILHKWNVCEYITFIPEEYCFQAGLSLYLAILEAAIGFIEYFIAKGQASIMCTFYTSERTEDIRDKPIIRISDSSMGVASIWCHIILNGSYKKLCGTEIYLDIPQWLSVQLDSNSSLEQRDHKIKWNVSVLLPAHDNKKSVYTEIRMKISFIRNNLDNISIDLEPTINKKMGLEFSTNRVTIQNVG